MEMRLNAVTILPGSGDFIFNPVKSWISISCKTSFAIAADPSGSAALPKKGRESRSDQDAPDANDVPEPLSISTQTHKTYMLMYSAVDHS